MVLDLNRIISGSVTELPFEYILPFNFAPYELPQNLDGVVFPNGITITGRVVDNGGYVTLKATITGSYNAECVRCLAVVSGTYESIFERALAEDGSLENNEGDDSEDYAIIKDGMLDLDPLIYESIMLEFPSKILCGENCRGMCPECGKNLNEGDCLCNRKPTDPRWDKLKSLFN
jgi:uncharacterized protein